MWNPSLVLMTLLVLFHTAQTESSEDPLLKQVEIYNLRQRVLGITCFSRDDELGQRSLAYGFKTGYKIKFHDLLIPFWETKFVCGVDIGKEGYAWEVYSLEKSVRVPWSYIHICHADRPCRWLIRQDAIYFWDGHQEHRYHQF